MKKILLNKWAYWPTINEELGEKALFLDGYVLNAGSGSRKVDLLNAKKVINFDISKNEQADIIGDLELIPFDDHCFDGILNVAVLEHCIHPWKVIAEFNRVLKHKGKLLLVVPFMQPIHLYPGDYYRFTPDGVKSLLLENGFEILHINYTHSIFHTMGWLFEDALKGRNLLLQLLLLPLAKLNYILSKYFPKINISTAPNVITIQAIKIK